MRPPDLPGGNYLGSRVGKSGGRYASMRPPDLPGGNRRRASQGARPPSASMRPPDLPGGNLAVYTIVRTRLALASMRPPDLPGGNRGPEAGFIALTESLQ